VRRVDERTRGGIISVTVRDADPADSPAQGPADLAADPA
jgi:hypothetical protein